MNIQCKKCGQIGEENSHGEYQAPFDAVFVGDAPANEYQFDINGKRIGEIKDPSSNIIQDFWCLGDCDAQDDETGWRYNPKTDSIEPIDLTA